MKAEETTTGDGERGTGDDEDSPARTRRLSALQLLCFALVFFVAVGVRVLAWQDARLEGGKVQTYVSDDYKRVASLLREGGAGGFLSKTSPLADLNTLGHPPGYSILLALVGALPGRSDAGIKFVQILADAA
ncbi:MAG: hypothetical protein WCD76_12275, partial [Pyrinomonadaceae bacterium]